MGRALERISSPTDLVLTIGDPIGDPLPIYYAHRRGWVLPTIGDQDLDWIELPADETETVRRVESARARGVRWLAFSLGELRRGSYLDRDDSGFRRYLGEHARPVVENTDFEIWELADTPASEASSDPHAIATALGVIDLLSVVPSARLTTAELASDSIARWRQSVAGESREVLFMHPPSRAAFPPARLAEGARLEVSFGVNEMVWTREGDGVEFSVYAAADEGEERRLFSAYVDPKHEPEDRRWFDAVVMLGTYAGQEVSLILETTPGPAGDRSHDWAGWSRAMLKLGPAER